MPQLYTAHDDHLGDFKKAFLLIFPENEDYEWCNMSADQNFPKSGPVRYKVDLVYQNKHTVAQKTAPMFVCFSKMFIVWMTETANKSE